MQNEIRRRSAEDECCRLKESGLTSYCLIMPYVWSGSLHLRAIFSSYVFPWMDSCGTALGTGHTRNHKKWTKERDTELIRVCWSNPYWFEETLMCFKSIFSCIQYVMLKWTASKQEKDYSSIQSKEYGSDPRPACCSLTSEHLSRGSCFSLTACLVFSMFLIKHAV